MICLVPKDARVTNCGVTGKAAEGSSYLILSQKTTRSASGASVYNVDNWIGMDRTWGNRSHLDHYCNSEAKRLEPRVEL